MRGIKSRSRVFYRDANCIATVKLSSYPKNSTSARCGTHGFERIIDQVIDNLLQLRPMPFDGREFGWQLGEDRYLAILQFSLE
jgi:hypothetical protein